MSDTLVLVLSDPSAGLEYLGDRLGSAGLDVIVDAEVLHVSAKGSTGHLVEVKDPAVEAVFDDWPPAMLPAGPVRVYSLDYRDPGLALLVVSTLARLMSLAVDNNYGSVFTGREASLELLSPPLPGP